MAAQEQLHPIRQALFCLFNFAIAVKTKRLLVEVTSKTPQTFWNYTAGILTDRAIVEWCKVFGSHDEQTHWRNVLPAARHDEAKNRLLKEAGLDNAAWEAVWSEMTNYRNMLAAHTDLDAPNFVQKYPQFDIPLGAANVMFDELYTALDDADKGGLVSSLQKWSDHYIGNMRPIVEKGYAAAESLGSNVPT